MGSYIWLIVILVLSILEFVTVSLFTIWFVISATLSLILSFFIESQLILFGVFVLGGIFLLITTRPFLIKYLNIKKEATNSDKVIGMTGVVTEDILINEVGEVKVDGKKWSATSQVELKKGDTVIIKEIKGVKLEVERESKK
ncbi:MAG: NfeD family protein [bacterium]